MIASEFRSLRLARRIELVRAPEGYPNPRTPDPKEFLRKMRSSFWSLAVMPIGTLVAKEESETRRVQRVNRVKLKIAVSGGFGGGVLS